ncbi:response regulator [Lacibacter sp. H375]|uniref:response regulator n=1 Tax=Lacibacter sp. H375 TaxID=3133424 RepID=UPI0030C0B6F4
MSKQKILIVDDEVDYCTIIKSYFQSRKQEVLVAHNLKEGVELLNREKPEILLLDNNLPDGKGWESVDEIVEKFPHLKIFLISAHRAKSDFSTNCPNITVWEKPISLSLLNNVIA